MSPVTLYDYPASANCLKARMLLALLGQPYERVETDIFAGATLTDAFGTLNPAARDAGLCTSKRSRRMVTQMNTMLSLAGHAGAAPEARSVVPGY